MGSLWLPELFRSGRCVLDLKVSWMNLSGEQQVALYLSSSGLQYPAEAAFEQIDWAAWMKFIAGTGVRLRPQDDLADVNG